MAHTTLVGHRDDQSVVGANFRSLAPLVPSIGVIVPVMTLECQQNALYKSKPVNI